MANKEYKYKILFFLRKLSYPEYQCAMKFLPEVCNTKPRTFKSWLYRKEDDSLQIPAEALEKIATFFDVNVTELLHKPTIREELTERWRMFKLKNIDHV